MPGNTVVLFMTAYHLLINAFSSSQRADMLQKIANFGFQNIIVNTVENMNTGP